MSPRRSPRRAANDKPPEVRVTRSPGDWYETRPRDFLPLLPHLRPAPRVLDLGCGRGVLGEVLVKEWPGVAIYGIDNDPMRAELARATGAYRHVWTASALCPLMRSMLRRAFPLVIGNPPFFLWGSFAEVALDAVHLDGEIAFLGPATVIEGKPVSKVSEQLVIRWNNLDSKRWGRYDLRQRPGFTRLVDGKIRKTGQDRMPYFWGCWGDRHAGVWRTLDRADMAGIS